MISIRFDQNAADTKATLSICEWRERSAALTHCQMVNFCARDSKGGGDRFSRWAQAEPGSSGLPCAIVLTVSFVLCPATSSFLSPSPPRIERLHAPGRADKTSARLDTSNGCQDHTTSPSATTPLVLRAVRPLTSRLALRSHARATLSRPSHPLPNVRDDAYAPLVG